MSVRAILREGRFPAGTAVSAYPAKSPWPGKPPGPAVETQTMGSEQLRFTTLRPGASYFAAALVNDVWRVVQFTAKA